MAGTDSTVAIRAGLGSFFAPYAVTMSISGRLLSDAVKTVPDEAFWIAGNKLALQNKVTAFERTLANNP